MESGDPDKFRQLRHKPVLTPTSDAELVVACMQMRTNANFSSILRTASCCGLRRVIVEGQASIEKRIARDGAQTIEVERRRSLEPVLLQLRKEGYRLIGLEQTTNSVSLHEYRYPRKSVIVIGNERTGISEALLDILDDVVEIPMYGVPYSFNAATATSLALYEFRRQHR